MTNFYEKFSFSTFIENRCSIIFDWLVGKQSIFFSITEFRSSIFDHSVLEWSNDQFFKNYQWISQVATCNIAKAKRKISLSFFYLFIVTVKKKKKGVVRWDLEGPISSGYLTHCSHPFFMSIHIEFSASFSMLSRSFVIPTSLARLFINSEFCQCPLRRPCQLQLFWYLQQTAYFCCISL